MFKSKNNLIFSLIDFSFIFIRKVIKLKFIIKYNLKHKIHYYICVYLYTINNLVIKWGNKLTQFISNGMQSIENAIPSSE